MSLPLRTWRSLSARKSCLEQTSLLSNRRALTTAARPFIEQDLVILRQKSDPSAPPILTKPLASNTRIGTHKGTINHDDIIGKHPRDLIKTSSGAEFRIHAVSLDEYVRLTKRLVTPIYPADANLIVSLLDLHVSPTDPGTTTSTRPELEILEAGTGHGSLTLHLSRAIHAANPVKPTPVTSDETAVDDAQESNETEEKLEQDDGIDAWKRSRRAVLHTIDVSAKYSKHARKTVRGFRNGLYADNVEFHVGDVSEWVRAELSRRSGETVQDAASPAVDENPAQIVPFLTCAFLDLPSTHTHLSTVASALRTDGILIVFNPSITQIAECVQKVKQENLPLFLEQALELGTNGSSGGREWDVRAVKPRANKKTDESASQPGDGMTDADSTTPGLEGEDASRQKEQALSNPVNDQHEWSLVCRPKVGERVIGGGFLGVFRKMKDMRV